MTAKEKLQSHIDAFGLSDTHEERLWDDINQFTLHIAEQAEKRLRIESRNEPKDVYTMGYLDGASDMTSRINELTQGE